METDMKELEIYYHDLTPEAQAGFDEAFGPEQEFNHGTVPSFIYCVEKD